MAPFLVAVVFCGSNRDGWFFKVPGRCRTPIGSNEGSGSHSTHTNDNDRSTARLDADNK